VIRSPPHRTKEETKGVPLDGRDELSVFERCRAGDERAWSQLFHERVDQLYRWCVLLGLSRDQAADAAQEVLATAARRFDTCPAESALTSWLYQITRRVVANARRNRWWKRALTGGDELEPAFEMAGGENSQRELEVRTVLAELPAAQVEVLVLMEVEGYTREETAEMLGIPPGTVASRLRLARAAFRKAWEEELGPVEGELSWGEP
jgi:RNA polymerase sigma-70 factor (ECF subfamily)